jgi:hypothetical protein
MIRRLVLISLAAVALNLPGVAECRADDWCTRPSKPENIVICADPELRRLAEERVRVLDIAHRQLAPDAYKHLSDNELSWTNTYTAKCHVAATGPAPPLPIAHDVIECYKYETEAHIAELNAYLHQQIPGYQARPASPQELENERKLREQAQLEREARLKARLEELGYALKSPVDLELDWRDLAGTSRKIAVRGYYKPIDDFDFLIFANNKDMPDIRLSSDEAPRDARKALLECRNKGVTCPVVIGGAVKMYVLNKGQLDEKKIPVLAVQDVFADN